MLIINATLPYWKDQPHILTDYAIYIENGVIQAIGPTEVLIYTYRDVVRLDAFSQWVLPGNICAHTHFHHALIADMINPDEIPYAERWLSYALDRDALHWSAILCAMDAIKRGTTTLFNFHTSPAELEGSLETIANALKLIGIRAVLTYLVDNTTRLSTKVNAYAENERFAQIAHQYDRIRSGARLNNNAVYMPRPFFKHPQHIPLNGTVDKSLPIGAERGKYDMWEEWRSAYQQLRRIEPIDPIDILNIGISNNASLLMRAFPDQQFGEVAEGMTADLIFVDYQPRMPVYPENIAWHLLNGIESWMVDTTIVGGEVVMRHRHLMALDERDILKQVRLQAQKVWERYMGMKQLGR